MNMVSRRIAGSLAPLPELAREALRTAPDDPRTAAAHLLILIGGDGERLLDLALICIEQAVAHETHGPASSAAQLPVGDGLPDGEEEALAHRGDDAFLRHGPSSPTPSGDLAHHEVGGETAHSMDGRRRDSNPSGAARTSFGSRAHSAYGSPAREPSPEARASARQVAHAIGVNQFDTYQLRNRPIGDYRFGELERAATANIREASVVRQILKHCQAPHDVKVRDAIKLSDLQSFIQRAAEVADAI